MLILTLFSVVTAFVIFIYLKFLVLELFVLAKKLKLSLILHLREDKGLFVAVSLLLAIGLSLLIKYNNITKKTSILSMIAFKLGFNFSIFDTQGLFSSVDHYGVLQSFDYVEDLIFFGVLSIPLIAFGCWKIISWHKEPPKTTTENEIWPEYSPADFVAVEPVTEINYLRERTVFYDHMDISKFPDDIKYPKELSHEILEQLNADSSIIELHRNIVFMTCLDQCARLEVPLTESGYKYLLFWLKTHDLTACLSFYPNKFEKVLVYIAKYEKTLGYWEKVDRVSVDWLNRNCTSLEKALDNLKDKTMKNPEIPEVSNLISPLAEIMKTTHPTTFNLILGKPPSVMSREVLIFMYNNCDPHASSYGFKQQLFLEAVQQLKKKNVHLDQSGYDYLNEWCATHKKVLPQIAQITPQVYDAFIEMLIAYAERLSF